MKEVVYDARDTYYLLEGVEGKGGPRKWRVEANWRRMGRMILRVF